VLLCYAQFPFWPSEPPRVVFARQDAPAYETIFRRFNLWMLGSYGIHTSVFPSAHVAGAFGAAFGMRHAASALKWASRWLFLIAGLIAVATVYGRYHYACDATAGLLIATGVFGYVWNEARTSRMAYRAPVGQLVMDGAVRLEQTRSRYRRSPGC